MQEQEARQDICEVGKRLFEATLVAASEGNISVRLESGEILISPSGVCKGNLEPHMMVRCMADGTVCADDTSSFRPSSEIALHVRIYQERPDVAAIVHAHPPQAIGFSVGPVADKDQDAPVAVLEGTGFGGAPVCPYAPPSSRALAESVVPYVQDFHAALLAKHGAVTWGTDLQQALAYMEAVERAAQDWANGMRPSNLPEAVCLSESKEAVRIVDQTLLPASLKTIDLASAQDLWDAIFQLKVRGAPSIGVAAAWGYYVLARQAAAAAKKVSAPDSPATSGSQEQLTSTSGSQEQHPDSSDFKAQLAKNAAFLNSARPTAVNLSWALERMNAVAAEHAQASAEELLILLEAEARAIHLETVCASNEIARLGADLLEDGWGIITHCNAGPLACLGYGTGQGPFYYAHDHGMQLQVYVDETRPLLQGTRLTAYELMQAGIDATLVCDNMGAQLMREGRIQACMVGCDRVAANGDVANKIGTSGLAILAKHYGIPFYVLGPTSTIDLSCATGADIVIEERDGSEITDLHFAQSIAPAGVSCYNPAFDVCDHGLVSAIITERGICRPPYGETLATLFED